MVRTAAPSTPKPTWHQVFVGMLPAIVTHAKISFRHLRPDARAEAIQEVVCNACCAIARLAELDKLDLAYPSALARFGVAQVNDGRKVGCKLNVRDVLSPHCQRRKKVVVERLDHYDADEDAWREILIEDRHAGPAETAAARIDIGLWFATLPRKKRRIAETLATGEATKTAARKFCVSAGRISQLRREFENSWQEYLGEPVFA
ncbi:MAG: hypothetical protein GX575_29545 [Candidatus Anammoximicrobium sp.]|nr:hypothetical protein [Candidatus Anammoximicrobium sp.]